MPDEFICDSCGKKTANTGAETPRFCSGCGGPLSTIESPQPQSTPPKAKPAPAPTESEIPLEVKIPPVIAPPPPPSIAEAPPSMPIPTPAVTNVSPQKLDDELDFADPTPAARCPNCGANYPNDAEICTACGFSRRLGRTITTRVGTPETPKPAPTATRAAEEAIDTRGIAAERAFDARKKSNKSVLNPLSDPFRLMISLLFFVIFGGIIALASNQKLPDAFMLKGFETLVDSSEKAAGMLAALFVLNILLTTITIKLASRRIELPNFLTFVRVAGVTSLATLAAYALLILQHQHHLLTQDQVFPTFCGALLLLIFLATWYLHHISFRAALLLTLIASILLLAMIPLASLFFKGNLTAITLLNDALRN